MRMSTANGEYEDLNDAPTLVPAIADSYAGGGLSEWLGVSLSN